MTLILILWVFVNSNGQLSNGEFRFCMKHPVPDHPVAFFSYVSIQLYHMAFRFVFFKHPFEGCGKQPLSLHASWIPGDWSVSVACLTAPVLNLILQTWQFEIEWQTSWTEWTKERERESVWMVDGVVENEKDKEIMRGKKRDSWDLGKPRMTQLEDFKLCSRHL